MTITSLLRNLFIGLISGSVVFYGIASVFAPPSSWLLGRAGVLSVHAADAAEGQLTLYVNGAVATSGDGRTPEQAFKTISEAIASASYGDTIQVAAGSYQESFTLPTGVRLQGDGYKKTRIIGSQPNRSVAILNAETMLTGFTIASADPSNLVTAVEISGGGVTVAHNQLTLSSTGISVFCWTGALCTQPITITHNIIDQNDSVGIVVALSPPMTIRNNTVVSNSYGIGLAHSVMAAVENNIVLLNRVLGIYIWDASEPSQPPTGIRLAHNNVWRNGTWLGGSQDYEGIQPGDSDLSLDPQFRNLATGDYRLSVVSPLIDQGAPAGTDVGALPFVPVGVPPTLAGISQVAEDQWQVTWQPSAANGYQIHVGVQTGEYLFHSDVGSLSAYLLQKVPGGFTYYVAINGYDAEGNETALSAEAHFARPDAFGPRPNNDDDQSTTAVINHTASQTVPAIDHNRVVWQDERFGPADIFLADLATGAITNMTDSSEWEADPDIDDDIVVWRDGYKGIGVHGKNLATGKTYTIAEGHSDVHKPKIAGHYVVWAGKQPQENKWRIFGYDLDTAQRVLIADVANLHPEVKINGHLVVWGDMAGHIYLYNWHTQATETLPTVGYGSYPDVSVQDNLVVWQENRNGDDDLYGYDLATHEVSPLVVAPAHQERPAIHAGLVTYQSQVVGVSWNIYALPLHGTPFQVTNNSNPQMLPATDGQTIVWQDSRNHQTDIYKFVWNGSPPRYRTTTLNAPSALQVGAFPAQKLYLQWQDQGAGALGYEIERAVGIQGIAWQKIATVPAATHDFTDTAPLLGETYWYRVRAVTIGDSSTYSNDSFNSTFDTVPSLNELYLMTLINEARAAPGVFGYPSYPPVPPLAYHPLVAYSARAHSQSVLNSTFQFGHCDSIGRCPGDRAQAVGFTNGCSENLTTGNTGYQEMENANQGFLDSEGHRNNMLAPDYMVMGVGHAYDSNKGEFWRHGQVTEVFCGLAGEHPALPLGAVVPYSGDATTNFVYVITFYAKEGYSPTTAQVVIDGTPHAMTLSTGAPAHGTYRYTTRLTAAHAHDYFFQFTYGNGQSARWPAQGTMPYPQMLTPQGYLPLILR